jgi:hypothetical protein
VGRGRGFLQLLYLFFTPPRALERSLVGWFAWSAFCVAFVAYLVVFVLVFVRLV